MPDAKLSELTPAAPAAGDLLYLVDVSDPTDGPAGSDRRTTVGAVAALAAAMAPVASVNGKTGSVTLTSADVGADPSGTGAAAVAGHLAAADPHPQYALASGLAAVASSGAYADLTGRPALSTVATSGAYSDLSGRPTLGTAAPLDVPAGGNAAPTEVVKGSDTRLSDARTPTTHAHTSSQISDSTPAGRAILTAADAAAQRSALGVPSGSGTTSGTNTGDQDLSGYATTAAVATGYQPLDADLTALAALTGTATIYYRSAADTWSPVTVGSGLSFTGGTLAATGGGGGGSPGGSGSEVQYRAGTSTFGALANVTRTGSDNLALTQQTDPVSPAAGELWNGSQKTLTAQLNGVTHRFVGCLFTQTTDVTVANTITESTLTGSGVGTLSLPSNFLVAGKTLRIRARGYISTQSGGGNAGHKIKLGGTAVWAVAGPFYNTSAVSWAWEGEWVVTCRTSGVSGTVTVQGAIFRAGAVGGGSPQMVTVPNASAVVVDTTTSLTIDLTTTWATTGAANSVTCTNLTVEAIN